MSLSPEVAQTPHEKLLIDAVEVLPVDARTDVALQLQDEAAENPATPVFSPVDIKRAEILLGLSVAKAKLAELNRNRAIAVSLNLTEEQIRAATVEGSAGLTQGNRIYQPHHIEPDGTIVSNRRHRDILLVRQHELLNPQARIEWGKWMKRELRRLGPDQIREYQSRIEDYGLVGLMPPPDVLWMGVRLEAAKDDLAGLVGNGGAAAPSLRETMVFADQLLSGGAIDTTQAFQRMTQGSAMGRTMLAEYQNAFNRWRDAYLSFPPDVQESILTQWLIGGQITGGQSAILANFYSSAFKQIGRESSFHSSFFEALDHVRKTGQITGYIPMENIFQALGSARPEVVGFIDHAHSTHDLWIEFDDLPDRLKNSQEFLDNTDKSLHFSLSAKEMLGIYATTNMLARLGTNSAQDIVDGVKTKEGFWSARNNEFGRYIFHKMGYSKAETDEMFRQKRFPRLKRAGDLSPVTGNEITDFWDFVGEVALDKMIIALTWIKWARWDVEALPLDAKRRDILSLRGVDIAAYRLVYGLGLPPEQFRNMITIFGSACSIDRKGMIKPTLRQLKASPGFIEGVTGSEKTRAGARSEVIEETTKIERPILSASRTLSRVALAIGEFSTNNPVEYRRKVRRMMKEIPGAGVDAVRLPEYWKWRWFENADSDNINDWRFVSDRIGGNEYTETAMRNAWDGIDFTEKLLESGLRQDEIDTSDHIGFDGWKNYLKFSNMGTLHWMEMGFTTGDKAWRYQPKVDKAGEIAVSFMEVSSPTVPEPLITLGGIKSGHGLRADLPSKEVVVAQVQSRVKMDPWRRDSLTASGALEHIKHGLQEVAKPLSDSPNFVPKEAQAKWIEATADMFMDGHFAHNLDALVEHIDTSDEALIGGDNFSVHLLYENKDESIRSNVRDSKGEILIPKWRMDILRSEGFYSVIDPNDKYERKYILSPLAAPLPDLVNARDMLDELGRAAESNLRIGNRVDRYQFIQKAVALMKNNGAFCWDVLDANRTDISPVIFRDALLHVGEEGEMNGATAAAIQANVIRFVETDHPASKLRGIQFGGSGERDSYALMIPLLNRYRPTDRDH